MKVQITKASTSAILTVFIQDSSSTTGAGLGSLDQTSSIVGGYVRSGSTGVALAVDENVTTEGTYEAPSTAGQVRIGTPANMTGGTYELHFHNDLWATGTGEPNTVTITLSGATNMAPLAIEVQLLAVDLDDAVRGGMTSLPNAAADGLGGLPISDAGGLDLDAMNTNINDIEADTNELQGDWTNGGRLDLIIDAILNDTDLIDDGTSGLAKIATDVAAVLVDSNELQTDWANGGRLDLLVDETLKKARLIRGY